MSNKKINLMPLLGSALLILLYTVSLRYRGLVAEDEYRMALLLKSFFPGLHGTFMPKLPASAATLATGALLWLAAYKYPLRHPGIAPGIYLCFPLVWWVGTSASITPLPVLMITMCATGIFLFRREEKFRLRILWTSMAAAGAAGAAVLFRFGHFNIESIFMALLPALFFFVAVRVEKTGHRDPAAKRLNRLAIFLALLLIAALGFMLAPQVCRFLKIDYPSYLTLFNSGDSICRPALALLAPVLWLYLVKEAEKCEDKIMVILIAVGFLMLALPPSLPWQKFTTALQYERLKQLDRELKLQDTQLFADSNTAPALRYTLSRKVIQTGWAKKELPPGLLKNAILQAARDSDAAVISSNGELEQFLPRINNTKYTLNKNCKMYLFPKVKKGDKI